jgi:hypothetical protein
MISTLQEANMFTIDGPIAINYSTSSIAGPPLLSYKDAELERSFAGDEIGRTATPFGELVTVTLVDAVDAFVRTFTVLIPRITLQQGEITFDALGVDTEDRSGAFVPAPGPVGVLQRYQVHQLRGVAEHVEF